MESFRASGAADGRLSREEGDRAPDSSDEILMRQAGGLMRRFVLETIHEEDPEISLSPDELGGTQSEIDDPTIKHVTQCLRTIGDELNRNVELQCLIDSIPINSARDVLCQVAGKLISDELNWGRIVSFFYFAGKLIYKALMQNLRGMIQPIINWSLDFIQNRVVPWIQLQGGWENIYSYFGTPTWQMFAVFSASIITGVLALMKLT
ncbi:apoptosis regulator BAX [Callorhinchus milii]|nr:apoptosis regulator BAX [Callorhinchus milii]|eukprot:gi/632941533/ref/XP_007885915.1/ PREDICTED: apoptosis regulator BAX-like [Callorhinchus milii]